MSAEFGKIADKPFSHRGRRGTVLRAARCDLAGGVTLTVPKGISREHLAADIMQIAGYHAAVVLPDLNGFSGYDTLRFTIVDEIPQ
jgi:hypothetical protein